MVFYGGILLGLKQAGSLLWPGKPGLVSAALTTPETIKVITKSEVANNDFKMTSLLIVNTPEYNGQS